MYCSLLLLRMGLMMGEGGIGGDGRCVVEWWGQAGLESGDDMGSLKRRQLYVGMGQWHRTAGWASKCDAVI